MDGGDWVSLATAVVGKDRHSEGRMYFYAGSEIFAPPEVALLDVRNISENA